MRPRRFRPEFFLLMALILGGTGSSFWHMWQLHVKVEGQLAQLNQEKTELLTKQKELENQVVKLNTPSYIEQLAREQLGLVRRGEIMIAPKK